MDAHKLLITSTCMWYLCFWTVGWKVVLASRVPCVSSPRSTEWCIMSKAWGVDALCASQVQSQEAATEAGSGESSKLFAVAFLGERLLHSTVKSQ